MSNAPDAYPEVDVAANVRAEVARRRIAQADLATSLGLNQAQVSRRLAGKVEFTASELAQVANTLGVQVSTFFAAENARVQSGDVA